MREIKRYIQHPILNGLTIALTELLFPAQRALPSLRLFGLVVTSVWYVLGVALLALFARTTSTYDVPPLVLGAVIVIALLLVVGALFVLPKQQPQVKHSDQHPKPFGILLLSGVSAFLALGIPALLWRTFPMLTQFPLVLVLLLVPPVAALILIWRFVIWARSSYWNDRHLLALVSGMLIAHSAIGALLFSKTDVEREALAVMGLLMVIFLGWLWIQIRHRKETLTTLS